MGLFLFRGGSRRTENSGTARGHISQRGGLKVTHREEQRLETGREPCQLPLFLNSSSSPDPTEVGFFNILPKPALIGFLSSACSNLMFPDTMPGCLGTQQ